MPEEGFKWFSGLSKALYGIIVTVNMALINGLLNNVKLLDNLVSKISFVMILMSVGLLLFGIVKELCYAKEEGYCSGQKSKRDVNRIVFKYLFWSSLFSFFGILFAFLSFF
jgi:hypothetical protein